MVHALYVIFQIVKNVKALIPVRHVIKKTITSYKMVNAISVDFQIVWTALI